VSALGRLLALEFHHFVSRRFFVVAVLMALAVPPLTAWVRTAERAPETYRTTHALELFAAGARGGIKLATYLAVVFASMSFAREFDHGTIKNILIRPVLRRDVFAAKCLAAVGVLCFLQLLALYAALLFGSFVGDLGHVWASNQHIVQTPLASLRAEAWKAVGIAFPAGLAGVAIGLCISNLTESSGWAVASALVLMVLLDLAASLGGGGPASLSFFAYPEHAFDVLGSLSQGSSALYWKDEILYVGEARAPRYLLLPAGVGAAMLAIAYPVFRFKDVKA
jgi:ABC-type transport system involved in multi-copper enzyme maturation permease subunit